MRQYINLLYRYVLSRITVQQGIHVFLIKDNSYPGLSWVRHIVPEGWVLLIKLGLQSCQTNMTANGSWNRIRQLLFQHRSIQNKQHLDECCKYSKLYKVSLSKIRYCLVISFYKKSLKIEIHSQPVHCTLANCICVYLPWRPTEN